MEKSSLKKELAWYLIPTMGFVYVLAWITQAMGGMENFPAPIFIMLLPVIFAVIAQKAIAKKPVFGANGLGLRFGKWRQFFRWYLGALIILGVGVFTSIHYFPEIMPPLEQISMLNDIGLSSLTPEAQLAVALGINLTFGIVFNIWLFLGEEIGWRGFMMPRLEGLYGETRAIVLGGAIWALWHSPLIIAFGFNYQNHPWIGHLVWIPLCIGFNAYFWRAYKSTGSVLLPAILHGVVNQAAMSMFLFVDKDQVDWLVHAPTGVIAAASWLILGTILGLIFTRRKSETMVAIPA